MKFGVTWPYNILLLKIYFDTQTIFMKTQAWTSGSGAGGKTNEQTAKRSFFFKSRFSFVLWKLKKRLKEL
jgi:hypothetical protein